MLHTYSNYYKIKPENDYIKIKTINIGIQNYKYKLYEYINIIL